MTVIRLVGMEGKPPLTIAVDSPGYITMKADSEASIAWFGSVDWNLDSSLARKLAEALIACADESEVA